MTDVIDASVVEAPPAQPSQEQPVLQTHPTTLQTKNEEDENELVDDYEDLYEEVDKQIARVGSKAFLENMQKGFATQTVREFKMNVYEIIKKVVAVGGKTAIELERLGADFEDLKDEVVKHSRLFNDLMSTSIIAHSLNLARLCLERVQDTEIRNLAQAIYNSMHPSTTEAVNGAAAAVSAPVQATP